MNPRILVVDDEERMAEIVGMVLRRDGFEVETFTNSKQALDRHDADPFDLVLTDLRMPAPDGLEVLRHIRAASAETPVVLFTAHATISNAIEALRDGAFDYIQKPFDNEALRVLNRRQAWQFELLPIRTEPQGEILMAASANRLARAVTFAANDGTSGMVTVP